MASNVYLIENLKDRTKSVLVDVSRKKSVKDILKGITDVGLSYEDISLIVLTHSHFDHSEGLCDLKKELINADVLIHESEWNDLSKGDFQMPKGNWKLSNISSYIGSKLKDNLGYLKYDKYEAEIRMKDKYPLKHFGRGCFVLHTPGHSKGSVCVIMNNHAIVGDTMYNRFNGWIGNYAAYNDDKDQVSKQWDNLLNLGCDTFYPGHGTVFKSDRINKK
jgi:glyoxylase-like metal-dependent hydrolase (beta-lactamase superfamily II)